jgi:hypothetical protein
MLISLKHHSTQYPTISRIANDYLAIQGSALASERAFSSGGITGTTRRNSLLPTTFEGSSIVEECISSMPYLCNDTGWACCSPKHPFHRCWIVHDCIHFLVNILAIFFWIKTFCSVGQFEPVWTRTWPLWTRLRWFGSTSTLFAWTQPRFGSQFLELAKKPDGTELRQHYQTYPGESG